VLWSDHGYHLGEKNTFQKQSLWERASHVPLVIAGPNVEGQPPLRPGREPARHLSDAARAVWIAGEPKNEGRSFATLLEDPGEPWPYPAIIGWKENSFAVQDERFRYIRYGDGSEELYDHRKDLDEVTNLAGDSDFEKTRREMAGVLKAAVKLDSE
jgi:hypothetical protein